MPLQADLHAAGRYLQDRRSQVLALQDALQSENPPALARAFTAVALAQGIERIATDTGTDRCALLAAIKDPARSDLPLLAYVVARLASKENEVGACDSRTKS